MKKIIVMILTLNIFFIINFPAFAYSTNENNYFESITYTDNYLTTKSEINKISFQSDEKNLDTLLGIILSVIPGFGVGHFWSGNNEGGLFFLQLDLIMLIAPLILAMAANFSSGIGLISNTNQGVFGILGIIIWLTTIGIKIWEVASVWRYVKKDNINNENKLIQNKEIN